MAAALALPGCGAPRTYTFVVPGHDTIDPLPMVVVDRVGLLVAAEPGPLEPGFEVIHAVEGRPNQLVVGWLGGACDFSTTLTLDFAPPGYTITEETSRANGCRLIGIGRAIVLHVTRPIDPAIVTFIPDRS